MAPLDVGGRTITPSAEAVQLIDELEARTGTLCEPVGCAAAAASRDRNMESPVGDLVADALLAAFPEADLAVQNSGGLRADMPAGKLRLEHLHAVMPFENRTVLVEMSGEQVLRMLRIGSSGGHGVLQIAGASYAFDPALTSGTDLDADGAVADWERERLCSASDDGAPIDPKRVYKVATTDFLHSGGDHLGSAFAGTRVLAEGPLLRDALVTHVRGYGEACVPAGAPPARSGARIVVGACP